MQYFCYAVSFVILKKVKKEEQQNDLNNVMLSFLSISGDCQQCK